LKRISPVLFLTLLLIGTLIITFNIQPVRAIGIVIRADGSVDPSTPSIQRDGNIYTFTQNITNWHGYVLVERSNIIIDGNGCILQGYSDWRGILRGTGLVLRDIHNVTIRNIRISCWATGILIKGADNIVLSDSEIRAQRYALHVQNSTNIIISGNSMHGSPGLELSASSTNIIYENNISGGSYGLKLVASSNNTIFQNNIGGWPSIAISSGNRIYHNNFTNWGGAKIDSFSLNIWDDGYPSGGNYWIGYCGRDYYSGPYQNVTGSDGIGDEPMVFNENNTDRYPIWIDSDGDRLPDGWENRYGLDPLNASDAYQDWFDYDGLMIWEEYKFKTDLKNGDTDGDGITDGLEVHVFGTDPNKEDTDNDGNVDLLEVASLGFSADVTVLPDKYVKVHVFWSDYIIDILTNSTLVGVQFAPHTQKLTVNVEAELEETIGVCNFTFPKSFVPQGYDIIISLDSQSVPFTIREDWLNYYVCVRYMHSAHTLSVTFTPSFLSLYLPHILLGVLIVAALCIATLILLMRRRRISKMSEVHEPSDTRACTP